MEALFRQVGIYAHSGQLYEPVDMDTLLYYKEAEDGQILEEGINEAGSMSSFIAAGTAYATHGINTIPFFIFYSMFGFQRVGDLIWAGSDMRMRGFVLGGTAGRTTLNGEGLQHQDGQSHVLASPVPICQSYDPAFAYELAVIIEDGIKRMYGDQENIFYYLTLMNEQYEHPPMPDGARDGILKGMYVARPTSKPNAKLRAQLFGSGTILIQALEAQKILEEKYNVGADVWSVTSYVNLYRDGHACERWNRLHPADKPRVPVRDAGDRQRQGRLRGGQRLSQVAARLDRPLAPAAVAVARHRRVRPFGNARRAARLLRGRCAVHHARHAVCASRRRNRSSPRSSPRPSRISGSIPRRRDPAIS